MITMFISGLIALFASGVLISYSICRKQMDWDVGRVFYSTMLVIGLVVTPGILASKMVRFWVDQHSIDMDALMNIFSISPWAILIGIISLAKLKPKADCN